jgi:hypothetical protein
MTLLDAKEYDGAGARRRRIRQAAIIAALAVIAILVWWNRFWPEKHIADRFFAALQKQEFETAYGLYFADPDWKQHREKYARYPYNEFWQDWGPVGQWGPIKSYEVFGESNCPGGGSGVVVDLIVNGRAQHAQLYVDKNDKTISTPPCDLEFR